MLDDAAALDVYMRKSKNKQGVWPIHDEHGASPTVTEAVKVALGLLDELAIPILNTIKRIE